MEPRRPPLPYFMTYSYGEDKTDIFQEETQRDYFRQLYPKEVKRYLRIIVEVLDRIDFRDSYLYDEYPDKIRLDRLSETILQLLPVENNVPRDTQRNVIKVLLYEEMIRRRNEKER